MDGQGEWEHFEVCLQFELWHFVTQSGLLILIIYFIRYLWWQAEKAQQIYIQNEKKLEEMLDGIEKLFGFV